VALFNALVWGRPLNSRLQNFASTNYRHCDSIVWFGANDIFYTQNRLGKTSVTDRWRQTFW